MKAIGIAVAAIGLSVLMFLLGAYMHKQELLFGARAILRQNVAIPLNYVRGILSRPDRLFIDVKYKDFQQLAFNRDVALERGVLLPDARDEVKATLRIDDRMIPARVRLKGDLPPHWRHPFKWSLRVTVRGEDVVYGMKRFSLQHPRTRNFLDQWFLNRFAAFNGLIGGRYDFLEVTFNGRNLGIYAIEEHFGKRLIENNRRREGPVFHADTSFYWYHKPGIIGGLFGPALEPYQAGRLLENPTLAGEFDAALAGFEGFREGSLTVSQVFDVHKLARFLAIMDLVGGSHGAAFDNVAFYYDPITGLLEPINGDQSILEATTVLGSGRAPWTARQESTARPNSWLDLAFEDPALWSAYIGELERIADPDLLDQFFEDSAPEMKRALGKLQRGYPWYTFDSSRDLLYQNQRFILDLLTPVRVVQAFSAESIGTAGGTPLDLASLHELPVEILGLTVDGSALQPPEDGPIVVGPARQAPLEFVRVRFVLPEDSRPPAGDGEMEVHSRLLGASERQIAPVHRWSRPTSGLEQVSILDQPLNQEATSFLLVDRENGRIDVRPGTWILESNLVLPKDFVVFLRPGTRLDLRRGASLISHSPLDSRGTEEAPVVVESSDSSGGGVLVLAGGRESTLRHTHFLDLDVPALPGRGLTGAVTFYESPVRIDHSTFSRSRSEDALNIIRSDFSLESSTFSHVGADALDVDFGAGSILDSRFVDVTNDGLDVSGTRLTMRRTRFEGAGDKAISIGERSWLDGSDIEIRGAEIGLAAKDLSEISLDGVRIDDSRLGVTAYQKKPEFGPGKIVLTSANLGVLSVPFLVEEGSTVTVNGLAIEAKKRNVADLMYGVEYGRKSD